MTHRARGIGAGIVFFAIAVATGCTAPTAGAAGLPRVSVYGDSVLLGASDQLVAQLAPMEVSIDAHESQSLLGAIDGFRAQAASMGDIVVLDLGYNDMADPAVFRQRIDLAMSALAAVPRVIWLNQRVYADGRAAMNNELAAAAARYPNLDVADWDAVVRAGTGLVYADGIHLTPSGQIAMASLVRQHVDAYVASRQSTPAASPPVAAPTAPAPASAPTAPEARSNPSARPARDADGPELWMVGVIAAIVIAVAIAVGVTINARRGRSANSEARRRVQDGWTRASPGTLDP